MCTCDHARGVLCGTHREDREQMCSEETRWRLVILAAVLVVDMGTE